MRRREFLFKASSAAAVALTGCGGSTEAASPPNPANLAPPPAASPPPAAGPPPLASAPPAPWIPSGPGLPTLVLHASITGTAPYIATAFPLPGAVPSGQTAESPEDASLRASVLSRWPDGSASVIVLAGALSVTAGEVRQISLRSGTSAGTPLTPARVAQLLTSISCDFGANGTASLTNFGSPEKIWWANERVICARYRVPVGTAGLEAVVDVHAFDANRAFVEIVFENGKLNSKSPAGLSSKSYSNATVAVNGNTIATVSSAAAPNGTHNNFRAWYCSTWIGGDPGVVVTHDAASLQAHPLFWKPARPVTTNYATLYGADAYVPWSTGRHLAVNMGGTGEGARGGIGPLPGWDSDYICSGNRHVSQACIASGLALLTFNINYRDSASGVPPSSAQLQGRRAGGSGPWVPWPVIDYGFDGSKATFESAHQPASPLVAFLCRPSPVFIELAQKILAWNHTNNSTSGVMLWNQGRSRGWRMRNYAIAAFLTPDTEAAWKNSAKTLIANCIPEATQFQQPWNKLNVIWDYSATDCEDKSTSRARYQYAFYFQHYMILGWNFVSALKLLNTPDQARFDAALDWLCEYATRYVNEAAGGEWRLQNYMTTVGDLAGKSVTMAADWGATLRGDYIDSPPAEAGPWLFIEHSSTSNPQWNKWASARPASAAGMGYESKFFATLVLAKERGVAGSTTAWSRVTTGITNFQRWLDGFSQNPIYNRWPRNV